MKILAHRGWWIDPREKNTGAAFERAFEGGFGIETDFRDFNRKLVISHDMPASDALDAEDFFLMYRRNGKNAALALNMKSDGLAAPLATFLKRFEVKNYFAFDMSVPDSLSYLKNQITFFTRQSEHEPSPSLYAEAEGVWLDQFQKTWFTPETVEKHLDAGKRVCIVSPELHGREHRSCWKLCKMIDRASVGDRLMICTDFPMEAADFFGG